MTEDKARTTIVAELGSNHDRDWDQALAMLDAAVAAGADSVKLQDFHGSGLASAAYPTLRTAFDRVELPDGWVAELAKAAADRGIPLFTTPFDEAGVERAVDMGFPMIKIASGDLTHHRLLRAAAGTGLPVVISTGAATLSDVEASVEVLEDAGVGPLTIVHCVSMYPTAVDEFDLGGMVALIEAFFDHRVGVSDHSPGSVVPLGAVALGGRFIEKHLTTDRTRPGPDHPYAMEPDEFAAMVRDVRLLESCLDSPVIKAPKPGEVAERFWARRGLYARDALAEGTVLRPEHLEALRPRAGVGAEEEESVLGRTLTRSLDAGEALRWTDL